MHMKETTTFSARIDTKIFNDLHKEANQKGISFNSLINSTIKKYELWEKYTEVIGFIPLSHIAIKEIFEILEIDEIKKIGKLVGGIIPKEILDFEHKEYTFQNVSEKLESIFGRFGGFNKELKNDVVIVAIQHNISKKFSLYIQSIIEEIANDLSFTCKINSINIRTISFTLSQESK